MSEWPAYKIVAHARGPLWLEHDNASAASPHITSTCETPLEAAETWTDNLSAVNDTLSVRNNGFSSAFPKALRVFLSNTA